MADYEATYGSPEQGDPYYVAKKQRKSAAGRTLVRWNRTFARSIDKRH